MRYVSADLSEPEAMLKLDITNIELPAGSQDIVICSHVLEHIPDDASAMRELARITRPTGVVFVQVPQNVEKFSTHEDPTIVTQEARASAFGQHDHVRIYGLDLTERLLAAGLSAEVARPWLSMTVTERQRAGVWDDRIYICRPTPAR